MPPRSFQKRRGKPRLSFQAGSNEDRVTNKRSELKNKGRKESESEGKKDGSPGLSEEQLAQRMWKHVECSREDPCDAPVSRSVFSVRYPERREKYIQASFQKLSERLSKEYGLKLSLDVDNSSLSIETTKRTWDPYSVIKGRDCLRLISRYVPLEQAMRVLSDDNVTSDIIEMQVNRARGFRNMANASTEQVRLIRRRARLVGPNGVTLRAMELLTECYILVYGKTVCVIGEQLGIRRVRRIVEQCMRNVHPIYELKRLMVEKELRNNPQMSQENWKRFLPEFHKSKQKRRKIDPSAMKSAAMGGGLSKIGVDGGQNQRKHKSIAQIKKEMRRKRQSKYTPWPKPPVPSKIDLALETGEYWNPDWRAQHLKRQTKEQRTQERKRAEKDSALTRREQKKREQKEWRKARKGAAFVAPKETDHSRSGLARDSRVKGNTSKSGVSAGRFQAEFDQRSKVENNSDVSSFLIG